MTTALALVTDVYQKTKVYPPGIAIDSSDSAWGLTTLNDLLAELSNERLACFANVEQAVTLVVSQNSYTIGTSGSPDVSATRPLAVLTGPGAAYLMDSDNNRYPVDVIEQDQWNAIGLLTDTSPLPNKMFYDPQMPLGIVYVYPTPSAANTLYFDARQQLTSLASLSTSFSLPVGYEIMLKHLLFLRIWGDYKSGDPPAFRVKLAEDSLAAIKRTNIRQSPAIYDSAVVARATGSYNIYTDGSNR